MLSHKNFLEIASVGVHNDNVELLKSNFFQKLSIERSILQKVSLKTVSLRVNRDVSQKKWRIKKHLFNERLFSFKFVLNIVSKGKHWSDSQKKKFELLKKVVLSWKIAFPQNYLEDRINGCGQERGLKVES